MRVHELCQTPIVLVDVWVFSYMKLHQNLDRSLDKGHGLISAITYLLDKNTHQALTKDAAPRPRVVILYKETHVALAGFVRSRHVAR